MQRNQTSETKIAAKAGTVEIIADPADAKFRLSGRNPFVNLEGTTPQTVLLPGGQYQLSVWREDYARNITFDVAAGSSERKVVKFVYGRVNLNSTPPGASVRWDRRQAGNTPLSLSDLKPGDYQFRIELAEYLPATVEVKVRGEDSITVTTNLINRSYANALDRARRELTRSRPNHRTALASIEEALKVTPDSAEALQVKASIESALKAEEARVAEEQAKRQSEQQTQQQVARTTRRSEAATVAANEPASALAPAAKVMSKRDIAALQFAKATDSDKHATLFDTYEWLFPGDVERIRAAVGRTFDELDARWKLQTQRGVGSGSYLFRAVGALPPSDDPSHCTVLASQVAPNETVVFAKFSEYSFNSKLGLKALFANTDSKWVPIHTDYYQTNKVGAADKHRAARADSFKSTLQRYLR